MILDENFAILEEDEDFDLLEEEDEILMEGEILDEEYEILDEALITSASSVDTTASSKALSKAKATIDKAISGGNYREFKSSDKALVDKVIKDKGLLKTAALTIAGSVIGAGAGAVAGVGVKKAMNSYGNYRKSTESSRQNKKDAKSAFSGKDFKEYSKKHSDANNSAVEKAKAYNSRSKDLNKAFSGKKFDKYQTKNGLKKEDIEFNEFLLGEALTLYLEDCIDDVLTEAFKDKINSAKDGAMVKAYEAKDKVSGASKSTKISAGAGSVAGAGAGALAGKALAKKILSGMKYSIFKVSGVTILSLYSTNKEGQAKGKSVCYAIATKTDGSKIMMTKVGLKSK